LIDGYNLLNASGVFGQGGRTSLESSREALLDWLGEMLSDAQRQRTTIVFDASQAPPGLPPTGQKHGVQIRFAPRGCEADEVLEELIEQHSAPRSLLVVSSDHRLHRSARRRRASAVDSDQWLAQTRRRAETRSRAPREPSEPDRQGGLDADELRAWLEEFGED
jgi:predicted RNA-binding protein with PIN domain